MIEIAPRFVPQSIIMRPALNYLYGSCSHKPKFIAMEILMAHRWARQSLNPQNAEALKNAHITDKNQ